MYWLSATFTSVLLLKGVNSLTGLLTCFGHFPHIRLLIAIHKYNFTLSKVKTRIFLRGSKCELHRPPTLDLCFNRLQRQKQQRKYYGLDVSGTPFSLGAWPSITPEVWQRKESAYNYRQVKIGRLLPHSPGKTCISTSWSSHININNTV